jgi:hypothetical protein
MLMVLAPRETDGDAAGVPGLAPSLSLLLHRRRSLPEHWRSKGTGEPVARQHADGSVWLDERWSAAQVWRGTTMVGVGACAHSGGDAHTR